MEWQICSSCNPNSKLFRDSVIEHLIEARGWQLHTSFLVDIWRSFCSCHVFCPNCIRISWRSIPILRQVLLVLLFLALLFLVLVLLLLVLLLLVLLLLVLLLLLLLLLSFQKGSSFLPRTRTRVRRRRRRRRRWRRAS